VRRAVRSRLSETEARTIAGGFLAAVVTLAISAALTGCGTGSGAGSPSQPGGAMAVVTTTTVFADMVRNVGGNLVTVTSLVPANGDVHTFEARPDDVRTVAKAKLLVMNGLGLDDWLEKTVRNASAEGTPVVKLALDLPGAELLGDEAAGTTNPHLWMNVRYAQLYVDRIVAALKEADSAHVTEYDARARGYRERLDALDQRVRATIAPIAAANRKVVMFHDAFPYFAKAYGITIVGVAVAAPGQDPSAGYTADLIAAIRSAHVRAIFSESQFPTKLVDQLAAETGVKVVSNLYDDALGDPPVTSYEALIDWDVDQLVKALS
jgi:ABC-type Zn uptake system ZnuABC Zn-binding protein ZnuA